MPSPRSISFLTDEGIRDKITLIASGGIRNAYDVAKVIALGADGVVHRHRRTGGPGMRALRQLRKRPGLRPRHRHHRPGTGRD